MAHSPDAVWREHRYPISTVPGSRQAGWNLQRSRRVRFRSDPIIDRVAEALFAAPGIAPSSALRHVPTGTESAPVHHRPDGKDGHRSGGDRGEREPESHRPLLSASRHPK